jgi:hypothetical protein
MTSRKFLQQTFLALSDLRLVQIQSLRQATLHAVRLPHQVQALQAPPVVDV